MVRPKKHLGQHFLKDDNICRKIADSVSTDLSDKVLLEIGPGTGALTKHLMQIDTQLEVVEVDVESIEYLSAEYPDLSLNNVDFLKFELKERFDKPVVVIGNFPYNISSQIVFKVIEQREQIPEMVGMFQREVARRICEEPGSKAYGILSVLTQAYFKAEYLFTVSENVFNPPPKVKSGVIRLTRFREELPCSDRLFFRVVKAGFNQRRKTLRNSLSLFQVDDLGEFRGKRPEQLSVQNFIDLTKLIESQISSS